MSNKLTCEQVLAQLYAYLDHEVDEGTNSQIDDHLEHCRECFSRVEFEQRLKHRLTEAGAAPTPRDVQQRLRALIKRF